MTWTFTTKNSTAYTSPSKSSTSWDFLDVTLTGGGGGNIGSPMGLLLTLTYATGGGEEGSKTSWTYLTKS